MDAFAGYDAWLERPYVEAAIRGDAIEKAIEDLGLTEEEAEDYDFDSYFAELEDDFDEDAAHEAEWTDDEYAAHGY
jgi:hypothetical protein